MAEPIGLLNVLVVEDHEAHQRWILGLLRAYGVENIDIATSGSEADDMLKTGRFNCAIVDMDLPEGRYRGIQILENERYDPVFKIMLTKFAEEHGRALLRGARRFLSKAELSEDAGRLKAALFDAALFVRHELDVYYQTDAMAQLYRQVAIVARQSEPVLIRGESGSGKELVAHALHKIGPQTRGPFEAINCACLDPHTAGADLFGVQAGGFTDASARPGVFERANHGTVFFDEVGELGAQEQRRLLRIIEQPEELTRAGGHQRVTVDRQPISFRCIFATDRNLSEAVDEGAFHRPLLERITSHVLEVPSLNNRRDDIPLLVRLYFKRHQQDVNRLDPTALLTLKNNDWRNSNVRGLWNVLSRALVWAETRSGSPAGSIMAGDVVQSIKDLKVNLPRHSGQLPADLAHTQMSLSELEALYIEQVLALTSGRIAEAARILGIGRNTLYEKIRRYRLESLLPSRASLEVTGGE